MKKLSNFGDLAVVTLSWFIVTGSIFAADAQTIEISRLHVCCGACAKAVKSALDKVEGVTDLSVDQDTSTATFKVANDKALDAALEATAKAGFSGVVKRGDEDVPFPTAKIPAEMRADAVVFHDVHLCCKGCARVVAKAYEKTKSVIAVDCDLKKGTVTITGKEMNVADLQKLLMSAGFYGTLEQ